MNNILFALEGFFPDRKAGTENYVLNLAENLRKRGWSVNIIIPTFEEESTYNYQEIQVYTFKIPRESNPKALNGLIPPEGFDRFIKTVHTIKPDIVHFHSFGRAINSFHLKMVKHSGIRTVFTSHLSGVFCVKGTLLYLDRYSCNGRVKLHRCMRCKLHSLGMPGNLAILISLLINTLIITNLYPFLKPSLGLIRHKQKELSNIKKYSDAIVSLSEWARNTYAINGLNETVLIKQTIGLHSKPQAKDTELQKNRINLLYVGRISRIKGLVILLGAVAGELEDSFNLIIAGLKFENEIKYYNEIKKKAFRLKHLEWFEDLDELKLSSLYKRSNLLCIPSIIAEMAPLVILESFSYGVPVIGSAHGGIPDMVRNNFNGLLFEPNNINDLKRKLCSISRNPDMLRSLSANIQEPVSYQAMVDRHLDLYRNILEV